MFHLHTLRLLTTHPLYRGRRLLAIRRYLRWQIASRLVNEKLAMPYVNDSRLFVRRGLHASTASYYTGLKEYHEMGFVMHFLRDTDLFIDVGANIGVYTVLAGAGAGARVLAFEPFPETFEHLQDNILLNDCRDKITALNMCVGTEEREVEFEIDGRSSSRHHVLSARHPDHHGRGVIKVPMTTLDSHRDSQPACIKIDVEGFETAVIEGGGQILHQPGLKAVIMELNPAAGRSYGFDSSALHERMLSYGFKPHGYDPMTRELKLLGPEFNREANALYLRDLGFIQNRVHEAAKFHIHGMAI